mgnify:CR=1 FL=1
MRHGEKKLFRRGIALLLSLSLALGCAGCGSTDSGGTGGTDSTGMSASAATMFLRKMEGSVTVSDAEGQSIEPAENLGLYSGYGMGTEAESFAWIDLDKVKLAKLDEYSEAAISKDGKNLSIEIQSGSLFFNVTEPLADDETMEIRSSTMLVGIRGTCGWMSQNAVGLLEGTVTVTAGEKSVTVTAGEKAVFTQDGALEVRELTFDSIPDFVAREILDDESLQQAVYGASGLRIPTTYEELVDMLEDVVYSEVIDFEADGSPELLVIQEGVSNGRFFFRIYRMEPEGPEALVGSVPIGVTNATRYACSLVERDGRLFVCCQTDGVDTYANNMGIFDDTYYGSVADQDGGREDWGMTDYFAMRGQSRESGPLEGSKWVAIHNEKGIVDDASNKKQVWEEWKDYWNKYTYVREIYTTFPES